MTKADIESIEKQDIRRRNADKQARANCKNLTATRVMSNKPLMELESEQKLKEWLQTEKAALCCEGENRQSEGKGAYQTNGTYLPQLP